MPLHPKAREFLDQLAGAGMPPLESLPVADARQAVLALFTSEPAPQALDRIENRTIPGPAGDLPVRLYAPSQRPLPVVVYFHGGGWVLCNLDTHDQVCRELARKIPALVVSVDYRLAPEHKFPAAADDCYAATRWVAENGRALGGDPTRLAIGGDSAGGNLAAAVALMARDRRGPSVSFQLLVYPATDRSFDTPSYRQNADGYFLTRDMMIWFWNHYLPGDREAASPYACPLRSENLAGLPPALVITAEFDPLRDEGETYAKRLEAAGVPARVRRYDGMIHGFFSMPLVFPQAVRSIDEAASAVRGASRGTRYVSCGVRKSLHRCRMKKPWRFTLGALVRPLLLNGSASSPLLSGRPAERKLGLAFSFLGLALAAGCSQMVSGQPLLGCEVNLDCAGRRYCARPLGKCEGAGDCRPRPEICAEIYAPVCSCDGKTYPNACDAAAAGANVWRMGQCVEGP